MWEFYAIIILIVVFAGLIYQIVSLPLFFINLTIIILVALAVSRDIKERKRQQYYLIAAILTTIFFIFRDSKLISVISRLANSFYILEYTYAIIILFLFAQLIAFLHPIIDDIIKKKKNKK